MTGSWNITRHSSVSIHTFTAPEAGWLVNSHIVELPSQLFVVDAQYTLPFAMEVVRYATNLNKPLTRLYVTHYHPDHLLGASAFNAPLYALSSVAEKIAAVGDRVASEEHEKVGDDIPEKSRRVDHHIEEGEEIVDDVRIIYRRLCGAETEDALVIALPDARTIIVQDLVYNRVHPFFGERRFDSWRTALKEYSKLPYEIILPGHGVPGGVETYDQMLEYLGFAEDALAKATDRADFKRRLLERFPGHGGVKIAEHQLRFLFKQPAITKK
jgi:glyoxylase-like metal-dependent hydrolase (beta-lactamase superfamily II)